MLTLILMAFAASTLGAISGLGGGVFIIPILVSTMGREWSPASLAALSLSVVILNSLTTLYLGKQIKNADLGFAKSMFVVSGLGAILGVYLQSLVSRESFEIFLSVFLLGLSLFIMWRSGQADADLPEKPHKFNRGDSAFGLLIGLVASFFGLGGGVLQVPYMVMVRKFAVKQATATSQIILSSVAAISLVMYLGIRQVPVPWTTFFYLAPVVVAGGILGSKLAKSMRGPWIIRLLATALLILAVRVGLKALEIQG
jgi:uncharacterized protein